MQRLARHALAILVLPVMVVGVIPVWIARSRGIAVDLPTSMMEWGVWLAGVPTLLIGGALFVSSLRRFGGEGEGTLAPWDPPRNLVIRGPYAYVRNPMISGVVLLLLTEAMFLRSVPHLSWVALFFIINTIYIPLLEEPQLRARFGEQYDRYCKNVPRLIPRMRPWSQSDIT